MATPNGPNNNRGFGVSGIVSILVAVVVIGISGFAIVSQNNNAQVLLLQEQQRIEKENRINQLRDFQERLERIEARSVLAAKVLDDKLQLEAVRSNITIRQSIQDLDTVLQREIQFTKEAIGTDIIIARQLAVQATDFEARLRVLESVR